MTIRVEDSSGKVCTGEKGVEQEKLLAELGKARRSRFEEAEFGQ